MVIPLETDPVLGSFVPGGLAVVIGATGGIGAALVDDISQSGAFAEVLSFSRGSQPPLDLFDEASIAAAAATVTTRGVPLRLVLVATGFLHDAAQLPEKSWRDFNAAHLAKAFAINAIGPALVMKHFLPLLPRTDKSVFAALSARVGSIGDNQLGGWYGYRAAKSALNQLLHSAAIELRRRAPAAICVALHPGTVATGLSAPFGSGGHELQPPELAARRLLQVIDGLPPEASGGFFDQQGQPIPW